MTVLTPIHAKIPARHPHVPERATPLSEAMRAHQVMKGLFVTDRGVPYALPVDRLDDRSVYLGREFWRQSPKGAVYRPGARSGPRRSDVQRRALAWLRDHVDERIPYLYYLATLGHDLHVSTFGDLYATHWHVGWANPFTGAVAAPLDPTGETLWKTHPELREYCENTLPGLGGFVEHLGWLSGAKVTTAFVSEEIDELVSATSSEYADFDYHEVGTSSTAESNSHTALQTTSGISRATGTPTDADPIYRSVATVTADTTETWQEHGIFNNTTGPAMMDRNLTGGQSVVNSDQVQYTFELTKSAEA